MKLHEIDIICEKYGIKNYSINSDGLVDVDGSVDLNNSQLTKLPLKFGKVTRLFFGGGFSCYNNNITTLEGSPHSVSVNFTCSRNKLITLEGCPRSVGGDFYFSYNQIKDLYGFPEFFDGGVYYSGNPVEEILGLFKTFRLGKVIDLLNEYGVIQQDGKLVVLDRLEEVFYTLGMELPKEIKLSNYEVY